VRQSNSQDIHDELHSASLNLCLSIHGGCKRERGSALLQVFDPVSLTESGHDCGTARP
jgi:hypothetical protein